MLANIANNKISRLNVQPAGWVVTSPAFGVTWADLKTRVSLHGISFRCGPSGVSGCP